MSASITANHLMLDDWFAATEHRGLLLAYLESLPSLIRDSRFRPILIRLIWLVPSKCCRTMASRAYFWIGSSRITPLPPKTSTAVRQILSAASEQKIFMDIVREGSAWPWS